MSNEVRETPTPTSGSVETSKKCRRSQANVTISTLQRGNGKRRRAWQFVEASEATIFEFRAGGALTFLHAGCASAARAMGVSTPSVQADVHCEVANDNALSPSLHRLIDRVLQGGTPQRETVTLGGLDHDACVVPQGRGRALCMLRPSRFAPSVAHDIHGCLAVVMASVEVLLADPGLSAEGRAAAEDALEAMRRASLLTTQLMSASSLGTNGPIDLGSELVHLVPLLRRLLPPGVKLVWEVGAETPCVQIDPVHLQRIVMNLVTNAAQAGATTVTVRATGAASVASGGEIDSAVIEVKDDGRGMSAETLAAVARGGFSSRMSGHGIGMSNVCDLTRLVGGTMEVESAANRGTRVWVTLPGVLPRTSGVLGFAPFVAKPTEETAVTQ